MFGAWQAGAWQVIQPKVPKPDWVIGASAGSLNAWAIAGGLDPQILIDRWLHLEAYRHFHWRFPTSFKSSLLDPAPVWADVEDVYSRCKPKTNIGIAITRLPGLQVEMVVNEQITARHLMASCAVPGLLPPVKVNGHWYWDGGLMDGLPHRFGREVGAQRLICMNVWVGLPWWWSLKGSLLHRLHLMRQGSIAEPNKANWIYLAPPAMPGTFRDAAVWSRDNAERWIDQGRKAGQAALTQL